VKIEAAFSELELSALDEDDADVLIQSMIGDITLPPAIKQQVMEKSEGNPFYLEEWGNLIEDLPAFENLADLPVPSSLTALVLSRIDRLEHDVKLLLQKAAVVGKEFFVKILEEIEKKLHRPEDISTQLNSLEASDFIRRMLGAKYSAYLFKHIMTQEVAYNTLLFVNRRILHHITAEVIEAKVSKNFITI
jgi:predicted ATPase